MILSTPVHSFSVAVVIALVRVERMIERDARVNGEFYIDTCIEDALALGLTVRIFEIDSYLCWGTPNDLRTFEYWQSCFHKWTSHTYRIEHDFRVHPTVRDPLAEKLCAELPAMSRSSK